MILYAASDLIWATRIRTTADEMGIPARPTRTPEMLRDRIEDAAPVGLVVDMAKESDALEMVRQGVEAGLRVAAFGPHVDVEGLAMAEQAGAMVMPRGAFAARIGHVLTWLSRGDEAGEGGETP